MLAQIFNQSMYSISRKPAHSKATETVEYRPNEERSTPGIEKGVSSVRERSKWHNNQRVTGFRIRFRMAMLNSETVKVDGR